MQEEVQEQNITLNHRGWLEDAGCLLVGGRTAAFFHYQKKGLGEIMEKIDQDVDNIIGKLRGIDLELEADKNTFSRRLNSFFSGLSKKAVFITSVPFYWFIIFKYIVGSFNPAFFVFVIVCSIIISQFGGNWGIMNALMR
jgi:hypothetical protein